MGRPVSSVRCWLMKSEPDVYSIHDLRRDGSTAWTGVRNYQARNFMRDEMRVGDLVFFYHSNAEPSGIAGLARVSRSAYPDATAFDPGSEYYDEKSSPSKPVWVHVDVAFECAFDRILPLDALRGETALSGLLVLKRGQRLSVQPVERSDAEYLLRMAGLPPRVEKILKTR